MLGRLDTSKVAGSVRRGIEICNGFDVQLISKAFDWIKNIDDEMNPERRKVWVSTVDGLASAFRRPLGGTEEARKESEDTNHHFDRSIPSQVDLWIFDVVASVVPKLSEDESPERLWEPFLAFGLERHHWTEMFLTSWFLTNKHTGYSKGFFREWRKMIAFANDNKNWREIDFGRGRYESEKLFRHLMGFSEFGFVHIENNNCRAQIASFKTEYLRWADEFLARPDSARQFARFLCAPCAEDYLHDGLRLLAEVIEQFGEHAWQDYHHLESGLLQLLNYVWDDTWEITNGNAETKGAYMSVLKVLADRQTPGALVLQDQIAREPR